MRDSMNRQANELPAEIYYRRRASLLGGNISAVAEFLRALAGSLAEGIRGSLIDFLQLGRDYGWLNLLERVALAINLATLYISLHRKLERRIRH